MSGSTEQVFRVALGNHLRTLRRARGLTEAELGDLAGIGADVIVDVERGSSSLTLDLLRRWVLDGFGLSLARFFEVFELASQSDAEGQLVQLFRESRPGMQRLILGIARTLARDDL